MHFCPITLEPIPGKARFSPAGLRALHPKLADLAALEKFLKNQKVRFIHQNLESAVLRLREKDVLASSNRFVIYLMKLWL